MSNTVQIIRALLWVVVGLLCIGTFVAVVFYPSSTMMVDIAESAEADPELAAAEVVGFGCGSVLLGLVAIVVCIVILGGGIIADKILVSLASIKRNDDRPYWERT